MTSRVSCGFLHLCLDPIQISRLQYSINSLFSPMLGLKYDGRRLTAKHQRGRERHSDMDERLAARPPLQRIVRPRLGV